MALIRRNKPVEGPIEAPRKRLILRRDLSPTPPTPEKLPDLSNALCDTPAELTAELRSGAMLRTIPQEETGLAADLRNTLFVVAVAQRWRGPRFTAFVDYLVRNGSSEHRAVVPNRVLPDSLRTGITESPVSYHRLIEMMCSDQGHGFYLSYLDRFSGEDAPTLISPYPVNIVTDRLYYSDSGMRTRHGIGLTMTLPEGVMLYSTNAQGGSVTVSQMLERTPWI